MIKKQLKPVFDFSTAASVAALCAFSTEQVYAAGVPSELPDSCSIKTLANGEATWNCCWGATCFDLEPSPIPTTTPGPTTTTAPATYAPTPAPSATPAPSPLPTECPTDVSNVLPSVQFNALTLDIAGAGILSTLDSTPKMECGEDWEGNVIPCKYGKVGPITQYCVLAGYDPPPLLRPEVVINTAFGPGNWSPFKKVPSAGRAATFADENTFTLDGTCSNPYERSDDLLSVVHKWDSTIYAPVSCPVSNIVLGSNELPSTMYARLNSQAINNTFASFFVTSAMAAPPPPPIYTSNIITQPPPARCYDAFANLIPCPEICDGPAPLPAECTNTDTRICNDPSASSGASATTTLPSGCSIETNPYTGGKINFCHTDLAAPDPGFNVVGQYCPGDPTCAGSEVVPGMKCGVAVPLLSPINIREDLGATPRELCPPDNWCINGPPFDDGGIHLKYKSAGKYNITIHMDDYFTSAGNSSRSLVFPAMGACAAYPNISTREVLLSNAFAYVVLPPSIDNGTPCYGVGCNYAAYPNTYNAANWPVNYSSAGYTPYASITTPLNATAGGEDVPFIDLPSNAKVQLSLIVPSILDLPKGGNISLPSGGSIMIPMNGFIETFTDGATLKLSAGSIVSSNTPVGGANASHTVGPTETCFISVIPSDANPTAMACTTTPGGGAPSNLRNPFVTIKTTRLYLEPGTELPITTNRKNTCDTTLPNIHGSTAGPAFCGQGMTWDSTAGTCVLPAAQCDCGGLTNCNLQFKEIDPGTGNIINTGNASIALSPANYAAYTALIGGGNTTGAQTLLFTNILPNVFVMNTCTATDPFSNPTTAPVVCSPSNFTFCAQTGGCVANNLGASFCGGLQPADPPGPPPVDIPPGDVPIDPLADPTNPAHPLEN